MFDEPFQMFSCLFFLMFRLEKREVGKSVLSFNMRSFLMKFSLSSLEELIQLFNETFSVQLGGTLHFLIHAVFK